MRRTSAAAPKSSARSRIGARVGEPIAALVILALGAETGKVYALFPSRDNPAITAELAKQGRKLLTCSGDCGGCAVCN